MIRHFDGNTPIHYKPLCLIYPLKEQKSEIIHEMKTMCKPQSLISELHHICLPNRMERDEQDTNSFMRMLIKPVED